MGDLVLRNGVVMTPEGPRKGDVRISGTEVIEVGSGLSGDQEFDCQGALIGPGFVDLHVHLREPGQEWKEDIATGSAAAAAGGFTAVVAMPNTDPAVDSGHVARYVIERGRSVGLVDIVPAGAITRGRQGEKLAHLDELWKAGVRLFSDDGDSVADSGVLRLAMQYIRDLGGIVAQHAEDVGLSRDAHMHEGSVSSRLGMIGIPGLAEEVVIARDLALAAETGVRYHVQHVSTSASVELVRRAKSAGLSVTAEATPHHLMLDDGEVESMDPVYKMYPPLRSQDDVAAVQEGLRDGTIDLVATDHAPHAAHEKDVPFEHAPRGVIGVETAAAVVNTAVGLDPVTFFQRMSVAPARLLGFERQGRWIEAGAPANIVVFDPVATWTPGRLESRAENCPFLGRALTGRVLYTVYEGAPTWTPVGLRR